MENLSCQQPDPVFSFIDEHEEWLQARKTGVGGSDVAAVLGLTAKKKTNPRTPFDVYQEKRGEAQPIEETEPMRWGKKLEPVVAAEFAEKTGKKIQRRNQIFRVQNQPWLIGNIDRYIVGEKAVLECKTANAYMKDHWGPSGTDQVPMEYLAQVQHYMVVTGYHKAYLAVLIGGSDFRIYELPYDISLAEMITNTLKHFWNDHVIPGIPPEPINIADVNALYSTSNHQAIEASSEIGMNVWLLEGIKKNLAELFHDKEEHELAIKKFMGENSYLTDENGKRLATWKTTASGARTFKLIKKAE